MYPNRLFAKPLPQSDQEMLIDAFKGRLLGFQGIKHLYLIGSASTFEMTDASDLDFVAVFTLQNDLDKAKSQFYGTPRPVDWPCDVLWYTEENFLQKSNSGGVCMIAAQDGRKLL